MYTEKIKALSQKYLPEIIRIRRELHMNPEIGFEEVETSKLIADTLDSLGIENKRLLQTGVAGLIRGGKPGKTVLLRADIDALTITEEADVPYKSKKPGFMHACGHDGHTAGLLGAAMVLNEFKEDLCGNVKLMFQPNEEREGGARPMIEEGILENPEVDAAFGCHLWGTLKEGQVYIKKGAMMASPDEFEFEVLGRGGHAAMPQDTIDPMVITAQIINALQTVVSRRLDPLEAGVISCCQIRGGESYNIIPDSVTVSGTIRSFHEETRSFIPATMETIIKGITETYGAGYRFKVEKRFPPLINDDAMTEFAGGAIGKIIGVENVLSLPRPSMGGEDFSYLTQKVPGSFFYVGIRKDEPVLLHNGNFKWDDDNLFVSTACLAQIAVDFLNTPL